MIIDETIYYGCCDNCGKVSKEFKETKSELLDHLITHGWFLDNKKYEILYCPQCYSYNEDTDELKINKNE